MGSDLCRPSGSSPPNARTVRILPETRRRTPVAPAPLRSRSRPGEPGTDRPVHSPQFRPLLGLLRACAPDSQHQPFLLKFRLPHRVTLPIRMETPPAFSWPQVQERQTRKIGSTATHAGTAMPTAIISGAAASAVRWPNLIAATDRADDHGSAGSAPSLLIGRSDSAAIAHGMVTRLPAGPSVGDPEGPTARPFSPGRPRPGNRRSASIARCIRWRRRHCRRFCRQRCSG